MNSERLRPWKTEGFSPVTLLRRWARELHRYTLVGGLVFLTDLLVYWTLMRYGRLGYFASHCISRTVGGLTCFALNRFVTFRCWQMAGLWRDFGRFCALYVVSFALSSLLVFLFVEGGTSLFPHADPEAKSVEMAAKVTAECLVFLFNYTVMKYWVFPKLTGERR